MLALPLAVLRVTITFITFGRIRDAEMGPIEAPRPRGKSDSRLTRKTLAEDFLHVSNNRRGDRPTQQWSGGVAKALDFSREFETELLSFIVREPLSHDWEHGDVLLELGGSERYVIHTANRFNQRTHHRADIVRREGLP